MGIDATFALLLGACFVSACLSDDGKSPVVDTIYGPVIGTTDITTEGRTINVFYAVPYAQPPTGQLRFKDPVPVTAWTIPHDASSPGPICAQIPLLFDLFATEVEGQEDCLMLDVYTPKISSNLLPVMVYIHGGGFFMGSARDTTPNDMLDEDVLLVAIQYRLATLGFLSTEDEAAPGNLGLKDQTLALHWIQDNIKAFGGDPNRVTIFGESAGAASVHYHMLLQSSEGLFQQAILQSGASTCPWAITENAATTASTIAEKLGCPHNNTSQELVRCLQGKPFKEVAAAHQMFFAHFILPIQLAPFVDGSFLTHRPAHLVHAGKHVDVDVMMGVTRDEGSLDAAVTLSVPELLDHLHNDFDRIGPVTLQLRDSNCFDSPLGISKRVYDRYLNVNSIVESPEKYAEMISDRLFKVPIDNVALAYLRNSDSKVYTYDFAYRGKQSMVAALPMTLAIDPTVSSQWVSHADDLAYLFPGNTLFKRHQDEQDQAITRLLIKMWTNFATSGNPTPDDSLGFQWSPTTEENFQHLVINKQPHMNADQRQQARLFWNSLKLVENVDASEDVLEFADKTEL